jgi:hypothetical protein
MPRPLRTLSSRHIGVTEAPVDVSSGAGVGRGRLPLAWMPLLPASPARRALRWPQRRPPCTHAGQPSRQPYPGRAPQLPPRLSSMPARRLDVRVPTGQPQVHRQDSGAMHGVPRSLPCRLRARAAPGVRRVSWPILSLWLSPHAPAVAGSSRSLCSPDCTRSGFLLHSSACTLTIIML